MFLALLGFVLGDRQFRRYRLLRRAWRIEWSVMAEIARVGSPIAVTEIAEMGMFFATTLMMGLLGVDALAAHAVTAQCYGVVFMIPVGLAQAAAVRVGRATGARDGVRLARSGWTATTLAGLLVLLPVIVFWLAGRTVAGLILDPAIPANTEALDLDALLRVIACIETPELIERILTHLAAPNTQCIDRPRPPPLQHASHPTPRLPLSGPVLTVPAGPPQPRYASPPVPLDLHRLPDRRS